MSKDDEEEHDEEESRATPFADFVALMRKLLFVGGVMLVLWMAVKNQHNPTPRHPQPFRAQPEQAQAESPAAPSAAESPEEKSEAKENAEPSPVQKFFSAATTPHNNSGESPATMQRIVQLDERIKSHEEVLKSLESRVAELKVAPASASGADKEQVAHFEQLLKEQAAALQDMKTQLGALDALKEQVSELQALKAQVTELQALKEQVSELQALKAQVAELQALKAQVTDLQGTLKNQIAELQSKSDRELSTLTAFGFLREAVLRGDVFITQLQQFQPLVTSDATKALVGQLAPYADKGIATLPTLQARFEEATTNALTPDEKSSVITRNLHSLISIRKEGEQQMGTDDQAIIARAEAKLNRSEVAAATRELAALSPHATSIFRPWMHDADAYLQARAALESLQLALAGTSAALAPAAAPVEKQPEPAPAAEAKKPEPAPEEKKPEPEAAPAEHKTETAPEKPKEKAPAAPADDAGDDAGETPAKQSE